MEKVILSYSAYNDFKTCPLKYYRRKIQRLKVAEEDTSYTVPGLIIHHAVENFFERDFDERFFEQEVVEMALQRYAEDPKVNLAKAYGSFDKAKDFTLRCMENMKKFIFSVGIERFPYHSEYQFGDWEHPVHLEDDLYTVGAADLIRDLENSTSIIYDYKATWATKNINPDQLVLYALAYETMTGRKVLSSAFFLMPADKLEFISISQERKRNLLDRMQNAATAIRKKEFNPTPSDKCKRCEYYSMCKDTIEKNSAKKNTTEVVFQDLSTVEL